MKTKHYAIYPDDRVVSFDEWESRQSLFNDACFFLKEYTDENPYDKWYMKRFEFFDINDKPINYSNKEFTVIKIRKQDSLQLANYHPVNRTHWFDAQIMLTIRHNTSEKTFYSSMSLHPNYSAEDFYIRLKHFIEDMAYWWNIRDDFGFSYSVYNSHKKDLNILTNRIKEYENKLMEKAEECWSLKSEIKKLLDKLT